VVLALFWSCVAPAVHGAGAKELRRFFDGSLRAISSLGTTEPAGQGKAVIARTTLTQQEMDEAIKFQVALPMRAFPELQDRLSRGELIAEEEMLQKYYPLSADYEKTVEWLFGQGLTITLQDPHHLAVFVSGSVAHVGEIFQTTFARVTTEEGEFTSAISPPSMPAAETGAILGINGLQPHIHPHKHAKLQLLSTSATGGNGPPFLPSQIALAYHGNGLSQTGAGQKIAIVIDTFPRTSDLTAFWTACNVSQTTANIEFIKVFSGSLPATSGEETLDVEWASAMAPAAKVRVYAAKSLSFVNLDAAYQNIINDLPTQPTLHQVSLSYGAGETYVSTAQMDTDAQYFASLASAGVTVLVSSGDGGSSPGTSGHDHTGPTQVETPANDPYVTPVGGTSLIVDSVTGSTTSESAWLDGGGGISSHFSRPTWQIGTGVPSGSTRLVPDVAMVADQNTGGYLIFNGQAYIVGGTSWSAPIWAGLCALINQSRVSAGQPVLGLLGPKIYPLLGSTSFVDITTGNNGTGGVYNAGPGFDLCTGVGVPNFSALLTALTPLPPSITVQPANQTAYQGQTLTFGLTASGSSPLVYQWQISTNSGGTWSNLANTAPYSGVTTSVLQIANVGANLSGAQYRCTISNALGSISSGGATLTVVPPPVITSPTTTSATFGQNFTYGITASNTPASFSASGLPTGLAVDIVTGVIAGAPTQTGLFSITLGATNPAGTGQATLTLTVAPVSATITLGGLAQTYDGTAHVITATTVPPGLAVAITYDGATFPPVPAASYAVVATVTTPGYTGTASDILVVAQASQTIAFTPMPQKTMGDPAFALAAAATSGLPVTFQSDNPAVATVSGNTVTIVGAGTASLTANQAGSGDYLPANPVVQILTVNPAPINSDSDVPVLPLWALVVLGVLLVSVAVVCLQGNRATSV
jgi:kumamolisin